MNTTRNCMDLAARSAVLPYVAGTLSEVEVETFEAHLIACDWCQSDVRLATAVRAEIEDLPTPNRMPATVRRLAAIGGVIAAAAAAVLFVVGPERPVSEPAEHRAVAESPLPPTPMYPIGQVESVEQVRWTGLVGARSYRLTLVDSDGALIWEEQTVDTFLVVPSTVPLETERAYFWKVDAQIALDRWTGSDFTRFEVARGPSPMR